MVSAQTDTERLARATSFSFCVPSREEVTLQRMEQEDGSVLWAILRWGDAWTKTRRWEHQSQPSSRTKAFVKRARWAFEEAWAECERIERDLGFGLPVAEVLRRCRAAADAKGGWEAHEKDGSDVVYRPAGGGEGGRWIAFPDVNGWRESEARTVAIQAVDRCRAFKIKVDLSAKTMRRKRAA